MKIKTSELTPQQLNAVVSNIEGREANYATDWAQGGPIIEEECIAISAHLDGEEWVANDYWNDNEYTQVGPTPLIAAMRCFVSSRLGDEVDVPNELNNQGEATCQEQ